MWLFLYKMNHSFHINSNVEDWLGKEDKIEEALAYVRKMKNVEARAD